MEEWYCSKSNASTQTPNATVPRRTSGACDRIIWALMAFHVTCPRKHASCSACSLSLGLSPCHAYSFPHQTPHDPGLYDALCSPLQFRIYLHNSTRSLSGFLVVNQTFQQLPSLSSSLDYLGESLHDSLCFGCLENQHQVDGTAWFCYQPLPVITLLNLRKCFPKLWFSNRESPQDPSQLSFSFK